jgi:hypothetical protein
LSSIEHLTTTQAVPKNSHQKKNINFYSRKWRIRTREENIWILNINLLVNPNNKGNITKDCLKDKENSNNKKKFLINTEVNPLNVQYGNVKNGHTIILCSIFIKTHSLKKN